MKDFFNFDKMYDAYIDIYKNAFSSEDEYEEYREFAEDEAERNVLSNIHDMRKLCHEKDTRMDGNFCNIREDWNSATGFIKSEVTPWGDFDDMVRAMDEDTLTDEQVEKVQQWCLDWFFTAFGTYWVEYNFSTHISEMEWEKEYEKEHGIA